MGKKEYLTVKEFAKKAQVSLNLIYHYIKKGLLPPPEHQNREKVKGIPSGGVLAIYDVKHLETIKFIRQRRDEGKSLEDIKTELKQELSEDDRQKSVFVTLTRLMSLAENGKYMDNEFKDGLKEMAFLSEGYTLAQSATVPPKIDGLTKKK